MAKLALFTWIGNAAAVLCGKRGDVTQHAQQAGCSRQIAYRHAQQVQQAVADLHDKGPSRADVLQENQRLREENRQLWQALEDTIDFPKAKQQQFVVTAAAGGVSDRLIAALLALLLGARAPRRATVGRWVLTWARKAGQLLQQLDARCRPLVLCLCLDEIFCRRRPVLVGVEPHSLVCVLAQRAADRSGATWAAALQPWSALRQVVSDAGTGLRKGLALYQQQRAAVGPPPPLHECLDLFHTCQEAQRALRYVWQAAEGVWQQWDAKQHTFDSLRRRGVHCRSPEYRCAARQAEKAQSKAKKVLAEAERQEQAWQRARAAFAVVRPDGTLNNRAAAAADLAAALVDLSGPRWAKVRNFVKDPRSLTFLDLLHAEMAVAEPRAELRAALVQYWQLRQQRRQAGTGVGAAALEVAVALQERLCQQCAGDWSQGYARVSAVLGRTVRASSVVECMNSVWRMHQARHRGLSQALLDLKRLWWNTRTFHAGKRKGQCPYRMVGLQLPTYDPWELLQCDPKEWAQQLSTPKLAA
jgi:hypothetical protein